MIDYRPMIAADVDVVPDDCFGGRDVVLERIDDMGAAAILAFDGDQHVGQLQFRRYDASLRSPDGLGHPDYWGDFGERAPPLGARSLNVFCYHVGQLERGDARDSAYHGRGIGHALLDYLLDWARVSGFEAIAAKFTPPERAVMGFMGGQPAAAYVECGFAVLDDWIDEQLLTTVVERGIVPAGADPDRVARVGTCVIWL